MREKRGKERKTRHANAPDKTVRGRRVKWLYLVGSVGLRSSCVEAKKKEKAEEGGERGRERRKK